MRPAVSLKMPKLASARNKRESEGLRARRARQLLGAGRFCSQPLRDAKFNDEMRP